MYTQYWNMTDEELLHAALNDTSENELVHELAMRLGHRLDQDGCDDCEEATSGPLADELEAILRKHGDNA